MNYNIYTKTNYKVFSKISNNEAVDLCVSEVVYQENFLDAFYLTEYDEKIIGEQQSLLMNLLIDKADIVDVMCHLSKKINIDDNEIIFIYLFSYPLFYLTHQLICNFLVNGEISFDVIQKLHIEIEKM